MSWSLDLPAQEFVTPNDRSHWTARKRCAAAWREATAWVAKGEGVPRLEQLSVRLTGYPPDKRRRDPDSLSLVVKWCIDGLVDAGVCLDDHAGFVKQVSVRLGAPRKSWRFVLDVFEVASPDPGEAA